MSAHKMPTSNLMNFEDGEKMQQNQQDGARSRARTGTENNLRGILSPSDSDLSAGSDCFITNQSDSPAPKGNQSPHNFAHTIGGLLDRIAARADQVKKKLLEHEIDENGCWNHASGDKDLGKYGTIHICCFGDKRKFKAHRVSYAYFNGEDPGELYVCHKCDNPACVNPDHLFLGTAQDNMDDMKAKGRTPSRAETRNGNCKLTEPKVIEIMREIEAGMSNKAIAASFDVSHSSISLIRRGHTWTDVAEKAGFEPLPRFQRKAS